MGGQLPHRHGRASHIALVHFIAHGQTTCDQRRQGHATRRTQCQRQQRSQLVTQPGKPCQYFSIVATKTHDFSQAFIDHAQRTVAMGFVFNHQQWHAARRAACHRPDRAKMVVGGKLHASRSGHGFCRHQVSSPAFKYDGSTDCTTQGATHVSPFQWRAGMQDQAVLSKFRYQLTCRTHIGQNRLCRKDGL